MATTNYPVILITDPEVIFFDSQNIRPLASISPERVCALAEKIETTQRRGAGHWMTGIEQPVIVYQNGNGYYLQNGQERVLAVRHLMDTGADYEFIGIPAEVRPEPIDLLESTRLQMALHDVDPVNIFDQTARAVALKNTTLADGSRPTWETISGVMGRDAATWAHFQHMLNLIPDLKDAVVDGRMRGQIAAYIGRDLTQDLQAKWLDDLLDACKSLYKTRALIQRILDREQIEEVIEQEAAAEVDAALDDDAEEETAGAEPAEIDKETAWLLRQAYKIVTRLEVLAAEDRLAGAGEDLAQLGQRFAELEDYA